MDYNLSQGNTLNLQWQAPEAIEGLFGIFREKVELLLPKIVQIAADQLEIIWATEARNNFKNADGYVKSIQQKQVTDTHIEVYSDHKAAWFLELGIAPFDLKRMLDTAKNVHINKKTGARYMRIPFEGKVKDYISAGVNQKDLDRMKGTKFVTIKTEEREKSIVTQWGSRLQTGAGGRQTKSFSVLNATSGKFPRADNRPNMGFSESPFKSATTIDYTWSASKFHNAVKMVDFQGKTVGMKTFRTISDASDANSWIHPGIQASHTAEKAYHTMLPQFDALVANNLQPIVDELQQSMNGIGIQ